MSAADIDAYLASIDEPKLSTLQEMRKRILKLVPEAEQSISYGMPAFSLNGRAFAGIAAFKNHLNYSPHSGQIFKQIPEKLTDYKYSSGSLQFGIDEPLPIALLETLIKLRLKQIDEQNAESALKKLAKHAK
ncbi:MAG: hypothetical protein RL556_236 [Actinomycetota bacterium]